jgi:hypothetical protein
LTPTAFRAARVSFAHVIAICESSSIRSSISASPEVAALAAPPVSSMGAGWCLR